MTDPVSLLKAWLALETLEPQTFTRQEKLLKDDAPKKGSNRDGKPPTQLLLPFNLESGEMPWNGSAGQRDILKLDEKESIRWYVPLGFLKMKETVDLLVGKFEQDGPQREKGSGVAIVAMACFDEAGYPLNSKFQLSSFGWATGQIVAGRLDQLHRFLDLQEDLKHTISEPLVERNAEGLVVPTTKEGFTASMRALLDCLHLPKKEGKVVILERPRVAIRVIGDAEKDPVEMINSFLLDDLHRVVTHVKAGALTDQAALPALRRYIGEQCPETRHDVLADKALLDGLLSPDRIPPARWPAPSPAKLVTLQQAAVNSAMMELADGGIMAVNGPPGTGKTTLLRDVVAAVIQQRADQLVNFDRPVDAFTKVDLVQDGGQKLWLYRLDQRVRGHGILVASSNNAAVRNVSEELPLRKAVNPAQELGFFAGTADAVQGRKNQCWGLVAAVLGNRTNRVAFVESAWWDQDWGLERYFGAITGRVGKARRASAPSRLVEAESPPSNSLIAQERWERARILYRQKQAAVEQLRAQRLQWRASLAGGAGRQQDLETARQQAVAARERQSEAEQTLAVATKALLAAEAQLADARQLEKGTMALRPGILGRLMGQDSKWSKEYSSVTQTMRLALETQMQLQKSKQAAEERFNKARAEAIEAEAAAASAIAAVGMMQGLAEDCRAQAEGSETSAAFWNSGHQAIHTASPWADSQFIKARDDLFKAAIDLHRAFLDAAASPMKSNLNLIMGHLKGKHVPSGANQYLGDLWDSLFLLVPLVSSTFASVGRLMDGMPPEALGWLIVDEAGQATPQAAVGALWRARRALIIGDPLQIQPVSTAPVGLIRALTSFYGAHPDQWAAPRASVQTLADAASRLMTRMEGSGGSREIGLPLLVHRRCQNPMFSIANEIAYDGLMVHAVADRPSAIATALAAVLHGSCWVDVHSESRKWSPQEGQTVLAMLRHLADSGIHDPDLYIISPFREVAEKLRRLIHHDGVLAALGIPNKDKKWERWVSHRVGTVHTFQGKEAEAVFLVLGASALESNGSRIWASDTPNILNVAATRAKQAFYVIGFHERWANLRNFNVAASTLPVHPWPGIGAAALDEVAEADDEEELWVEFSEEISPSIS
jgi:energy-coupling factor transporter ATP-binding protein EcfA2